MATIETRVKLAIKSLVELNLYTESGLAKLAVGVRVEQCPNGTLTALDSAHSYSYTAFHRGGDPDLPVFNEELELSFEGCYREEEKPLDGQLVLKLRIVEEGPVAVRTIPYDSRSASPIYEILPTEQKRSIIARGRLVVPPIPAGQDVFEKLVRVELREVASEQLCGGLEVALCVTTAAASKANAQGGTPLPLLVTPRASVLGRMGSAPDELRRSVSSVSSSFKLVNSSRVFGNFDGEIDLEASIKTKSEGTDMGISSDGSINGDDSITVDGDISGSDLPDAEFAEVPTRPSTAFQSEIAGLLSLEIVAAQDLPRERRFLRTASYDADAFVVISCGKHSFRTKVCRNSLNPAWKERLAFSIRSNELGYLVTFSVYDYDSFGSNTCLGKATIRLAHFTQNQEQRLKLAIPLNLTKPSVGKDACLLVKGSFTSYEAVRKAFWSRLLRSFDLNHNGRICRLELETMLETLGSTLSESTIAKVFEAVDQSVDQEIDVEEAVKFLEDLTVRAEHRPERAPSTHSLSQSQDTDPEKIVILDKCPFCQRSWPGRTLQTEVDVITHLGICSAGEEGSSRLDRFVMGGFLTEEYASRKWFVKLLSFMSFGNYQIGRNNGNILVQDRKTGKLLEEKMPTYIRLGIRLLHQNVVTFRTAIDFGYARSVFQSLTIQQGRKFDHPSSVRNIPGFIKYHKIPVHEIAEPLTSFSNFNDFFYRKIKLEYRPIAAADDPDVVVSPADCRVNVFETVSEATRLWIKGLSFSATELLKDAALGKYFEGGSLVLCRLAPQDYHRFHSPVEGRLVMNYHIPGTYYTVNPMAVRQKVDVFTENARTVCVIDSLQFGKVAFVAIGAMMVGSIAVTVQLGDELRRGDEVGYFAFGGSTIVVLFSKEQGRVLFDADLVANSREQLETLIQMGDSIGRKIK